MRLTLRTLIAYLDDELQPDQAKEIGQKLSESSYATALVERIKEVMRRRRLTAPELFGKGAGLDPNLVAEYLDSELTPAEVVDVEKVCLDSDMHLAEVAACHQILTLVLGDPVEVRAETRSRMYGLGPVATDDAVRANDFVGVSLGREGASVPMIASALNPSHNGSPDRTLPEYLQPKTSWRKTAVLVLVVLVGVGWFSLLMRDPTVTSGLRPASPPDETRNLTKATESTAAADRRAPSSEEPGASKPDDRQVAKVDLDSKRRPREGRTIESQARPDAPATPDAAPISESPRPTTADASKTSRPVPPPPPLPADAAPLAEPEAAPKLMPPLALARSSKDGIVLRFEPEVGDFLVLPRVVQLKANDFLACPEPFRADFTIGDDVGSVALIGGTAARFLGPDAQSSVGFDVQQGALLFEARGMRGAAEAADPAIQRPRTFPITLTFYGRATRLELASDDAVCGIEVRRREPIRFESELEAPGFSAALHVASGVVRFTGWDGQTVTLQGPSFLPITEDATPTEKKSELGRASQLVLPDWLEPDPKRAAAKLKRPYNIAFEKEFDAEQPLLLSLPAVVHHPRPAISELAVKCLALTDSFAPLVKALSQSEHREARLAAITGLRQWLPLDPRNRQLLKAELAKSFLPSDADAVYRLLWGFDLADAKSPATSRTLVGWLESEQLAIRELAFFHVQRLTGLKNDYSPINPPGQRRAAVDRWYSHLEKRGGALVQE